MLASYCQQVRFSLKNSEFLCRNACRNLASLEFTIWVCCFSKKKKFHRPQMHICSHKDKTEDYLWLV